MLAAAPALAARFPAVINFPGYTPAQLAGVFTALAGEAGFTPAPDALAKAAAVLGPGQRQRPAPVQLLNHAATAQARRITAASQPSDAAALSGICAVYIPGHLDPAAPPALD